MNKDRISLTLQALSFIMLAVVCFGQLPIEKAITHLTIKYAKQAEFKARGDMCGKLAVQHEAFSEQERETWIAGCLWDLKVTNLTIFEGNKEKQEALLKIFQDPNSPEYLDFYNFCEHGATDEDIRGQLDDKIIAALWPVPGCDTLADEEEQFKENQ